MNSANSKELRRYLRSVKKALPYEIGNRNEVLSAIKTSAQTYVSEHPEADHAELEKQFGAAKDIAEEYYGNGDPSAIRLKVKSNKKIVRWVAVVLAVIFVLLAGIHLGIIIHDLRHANDYYDVIEIYEWTIPDDEDVDNVSSTDSVSSTDME